MVWNEAPRAGQDSGLFAPEAPRERVLDNTSSALPSLQDQRRDAPTAASPDELGFWSYANNDNWAKSRPQAEVKNQGKMADPFEVRMRFSSQLQHLNASVVSAQKAAQYALKNKEMSEDLHSCILEQLEKNSMNTRANIMYFIEHFLEMASKERHADYVRMMQRDIIRVVDAVCPEDGSGAANVKVVRKVLQGLNEKGFLLDQTVTEIEECLKDRATNADVGMSSPANGDSAKEHDGEVNGSSSHHRSGRNGARLEKRQIEQRIEEDRERHKKRRENMWLVPKDHKEGAWKFWDETSDVSDDDYTMAREEWEEYEKAVEGEKCKHNRPRVTNGSSRHGHKDL